MFHFNNPSEVNEILSGYSIQFPELDLSEIINSFKKIKDSVPETAGREVIEDWMQAILRDKQTLKHSLTSK